MVLVKVRCETDQCPKPENKGEKINAKDCPVCRHFEHLSYEGGFPIVVCMYPQFKEIGHIAGP